MMDYLENWKGLMVYVALTNGELEGKLLDYDETGIVIEDNERHRATLIPFSNIRFIS